MSVACSSEECQFCRNIKNINIFYFISHNITFNILIVNITPITDRLIKISIFHINVFALDAHTLINIGFYNFLLEGFSSNLGYEECNEEMNENSVKFNYIIVHILLHAIQFHSF